MSECEGGEGWVSAGWGECGGKGGKGRVGEGREGLTRRKMGWMVVRYEGCGGYRRTRSYRGWMAAFVCFHIPKLDQHIRAYSRMPGRGLTLFDCPAYSAMPFARIVTTFAIREFKLGQSKG